MQKSGWLLWRSWRSGQTRKSINQLKETLQKEDILYCHEFELAGLKVKLEEQLAAERNIDSLVYKLEVSINRCNKEIEALKETNVKIRPRACASPRERSRSCNF